MNDIDGITFDIENFFFSCISLYKNNSSLLDDFTKDLRKKYFLQILYTSHNVDEFIIHPLKTCSTLLQLSINNIIENDDTMFGFLYTKPCKYPVILFTRLNRIFRCSTMEAIVLYTKSLNEGVFVTTTRDFYECIQIINTPSHKKLNYKKICSSCDSFSIWKLKKCKRCGIARYCDIDCQHDHWSIHKYYCNRPMIYF